MENTKARMTIVVEMDFGIKPTEEKCGFCFAKIFVPKLTSGMDRMALANIARGAIEAFTNGPTCDQAVDELKELVSPKNLSTGGPRIRDHMTHLAEHGMYDLQEIELSEGEVCSA